MKKQFTPARPGWRVQFAFMADPAIIHERPLAGWSTKKSGRIVPVFWWDMSPSQPSMWEAVPDPREGWYFHVVAPGEPMLSKEQIAQEIRQIDNDWTGQESIYTQLQMRRIDATAFEYAGAREYGRFLAIPPYRRLEGFSAWLANEAAQ